MECALLRHKSSLLGVRLEEALVGDLVDRPDGLHLPLVLIDVERDRLGYHRKQPDVPAHHEDAPVSQSFGVTEFWRTPSTYC